MTGYRAVTMPTVLVLDANQRSALAIIRSLGLRGLTVIAADKMKKSLGGASRFAVAAARYADPATSPREFLADLTAIIARWSVDTIIPATDLTTMLLVNQQNWSHFGRLAIPGREAYETLTDKARLIGLAQTLGISVPATRIVHTQAAIREAAEEFLFPLVLKPARSRYLKEGRIHSTAVEIVTHSALLDRALERCAWIADIPCLVQRFVPGHGAGIFAAFSRSGPVAWFAHRRLREKPPQGGVSVLSESVRVDPTMRDAEVPRSLRKPVASKPAG